MPGLCACDHQTDMHPRDVTFVSDGRPCCSARCYDAAEARRAARQLRARQEGRTLRRVPFSDEDEADRVAEPYAKSLYARYQDL